MLHHTRPRRQDTLELRDHGVQDQDHLIHHQAQQQQLQYQQQHEQQYQSQYASDEDHSVLEDDSGDEQYIEDEDDGSSSLSIPSESIDFDLVYSIQTFVATVEGQANVVKGDSLFLMDDSNSYWWLVRVLKTQEVGYIPAENIETPFERLARLNKHRNVDLASATPAERHEDLRATRERMRQAMGRTTSPGNGSKTVIFTGGDITFRYPAFLWGHEGELDEESDEEGYGSYEEGEEGEMEEGGLEGMEPDDGMSWEDGVAEQAQARHVEPQEPDGRDPRLQQQQGGTPAALRPGAGSGPSQVQMASNPTSQQSQLGLGAAPSVRSQSSRERLVGGQQDPGRGYVDPADATGTRQISVTPSVARGPDAQKQEPRRSSSPGGSTQSQQSRSAGQQGLHRSISGESSTSLTSATSESVRKAREDAGNESDASEMSRNKKGKKQPAESTNAQSRSRKSGGSTPDAEESGGEKEKKKRGGVFSSLFSSKKNKDKKDKDGKKGTTSTGTDADSGSIGRASEDSGASPSTSTSPPENTQLSSAGRKPVTNSTDPRRGLGIVTKESQPTQPLSTHASRMQQKDLQEQALYQQYLNRSPLSPPDASAAYGLQSAASQGLQASPSNLNPNRPFNNRPGSLILTNNSLEGGPVPELSVMRVFAGERLQSEATFKTVLLNMSTTAADLVRQAIQRFRLSHGEDENDYFLTVKQFEGEEAVLRKDEHPLAVFEELVESAMNMPTVKRSSISSITSNLSMQPAITKLGMNDFTDDSTVKFYLNRRPSEDNAYRSSPAPGPAQAASNRASDTSIIKDDVSVSSSSRSGTDHIAATLGKLSASNGRPQLTLNVGITVPPERFSSPTARFAIQVVIYPEDLPDGMVFDPHTEAIIPRYSLQSRSQNGAMISPGVSQTHRKKVFVFPKNTTVAEVIEQSLDMFGIQEGVVDGGDEVEDKMSKRRSSRVRYGLAVQPQGDQAERELNPSSKVIEAFARPPAFKQNNRRSSDLRRRSIDSSQLLGSMDDVQSGDPVFVLRRVTTYRSSTSRNRLSAAPLDDLALHHLQRESIMSDQSIQSEYTSPTESPRSPPKSSQRELIAAQRAAFRANQRAILTAQANSEEGVDLMFPDKTMLRSARSGGDERMRYSYVQADGETYDISDIIEEELWDVAQSRSGSRTGRTSMDEDVTINLNTLAKTGARNGTDLLGDVLVKPRDVVEQRIDQVLAKIKDGKRASALSVPPGENSRRSPDTPMTYEDRRSPTPRVGSGLSRSQQSGSGSRSNTPVNIYSRSSPQPTNSRNAGNHSQRPSITSVVSDSNPTEVSTPPTKSSLTDRSTPGSSTRPPIIMKDDFGLSKMLAVIEANASQKKPMPPPLTEVEEMLFGPPISLDELHPVVRELYAPVFNQLEDVNQQLDLLLQATFKP
ncbi:hypothetical protein FRB99_008336 [Tulasnella sp. 403]|nr:hypothetical protein FRB99_008336 [Tulasnella sp. 403]